MVEDGWEKLANDPSATAIVEKMARHYRRDSAVVEEIMDKVDQVIEASTPDEPLYVTCVRVYEEWRATKSKDAFQTLILIDDLRLYAKSLPLWYAD
jgi:hypothetical protein